MDLLTPVTPHQQSRRFPWMTMTLCLVLLINWLVYRTLDPLQQRIVIETAGASPAQIANMLTVGGPGGGSWSVLSLSLLFHSSGLHLLGNIAYLWVFGLPVERKVGPAFLLLVLILGGAFAHLVLAVRLPHLDLPVIGASGAVSSVVGACAGLFPSRRIGLYLPLGVVVEFIRVPTLVVVGSWFVLQLFYSMLGPISGAMAWWTHLAGFAAGLMLALLLRMIVAAWRRRFSLSANGKR